MALQAFCWMMGRRSLVTTNRTLVPWTWISFVDLVSWRNPVITAICHLCLTLATANNPHLCHCSIKFSHCMLYQVPPHVPPSLYTVCFLPTLPSHSLPLPPPPPTAGLVMTVVSGTLLLLLLVVSSACLGVICHSRCKRSRSYSLLDTAATN